MRGAGLKKCIPTTRSGARAAEATAVTDSEEVLVASTHSPETISDNRAKSSCLSWSDSGAASITSSQGASSSIEAAARRWAAASASSAVQRPRWAPLARFSRTAAAPRSRASGIGSCRRVRAPDRQASWAMPEPMVPAPTTPMTWAGPKVRPGPAR